MDTDQQVRLDFLSEADKYFNSLESLLMDLDAQGAESSLLDTAMRSAHSLKGGAAMMRYSALGKIAHRLEDFLKILRVRKDNNLVDKEVTNLLLQGVDCMRIARDLHQQQDVIDESWLTQNANPVFEGLRSKLGDLKEEDEDLLLAEEEQIDVSSLIFQSGVEECLASFEPKISTLEPAQLKAELEVQTEQLAEFGLMSQIEPFVQLCRSVQQQIAVTPLEEMRDLAHQAYKLWDRSQALVLVGRVDKLPTSLNGRTEISSEAIAQQVTPNVAPDEANLDKSFNPASNSVPDQTIQATDGHNLDFLETDFTSEDQTNNTQELSDLNVAFDNLDHSLSEVAQLSTEIAAPEIVDLDQFAPDIADLSDLDAAFSELNSLSAEVANLPTEIATPEIAALDQSMTDGAEAANLDAASATNSTAGIVDLDQFIPDAAELSDLDATFAQISDSPEIAALPVAESEEPATFTPAIAPRQPQKSSRMVRVPAEQLERLNDLSSRLILERNAAMLRLNQLRDFVNLTRERMHRLEQSSSQLRKLYDWASLEGTIPTAQPVMATANSAWESTTNSSELEKFDALEMDRYTDLHLLSQSQMETIVQLQEVTTDIDFGIQEMSQVIRNFSYTTRELQQTVTRSQMRPFAELVNRFPRLIRDLSNQHNKEVNLVIEGQTTQIDRQAMEYLSDPLTHLLRNAFDHGLEDAATRQAAGKPAVGTITLKATQQGSQTIITVTDNGGGINTQKIRDRLCKMGLSTAEVERIPEAEVLDAIFEPGFSTASQVTELSGRGVGMDVVRSNLHEIRGNIQVKTELGRGTTFTIAVPLSLLVMRVVIVESGGMVFAVPVHSIKEIIEYDAKLVSTSEQQEFLTWNNHSLGLIRPQQYLQFNRPSKSFDMSGSPKINRPTILIFENSGQLQGIYLEKYWLEQEVAIRTVNTSITLFPGFAGSTVLGDGRVIPLVEPHAFYQGMIAQQSSPSSSDDLIASSNTGDADFPATKTSTVLVVDDSVHIRRYLAGVLERNGYQVEEAKDGQDAVDKLMGGLPAKAVICDIEMPRLDGYGVLSEIKSEAKFEQLPIAMLTSRSNHKHRQLAMKLGAAAYFSKPFNEQEMLQTLENMIAQSQATD
ncbi:MAG: hybrid sensor histidine kinase/response regulator [Cyanobacteria bacterium P01_C01_bin.72]